MKTDFFCGDPPSIAGTFSHAARIMLIHGETLATLWAAISTQNHGFAVEPDSLVKATTFGTVEVTHRSPYDDSVEGLRCLDIPAFSVQYHPEAGPDPYDARYLFEQFLSVMRR